MKTLSNLNFIDYINELEQLNNQVKHLEIELTAGVLAYEVLKNGNISNEKQQLIRATAVSLNDMNWLNSIINK